MCLCEGNEFLKYLVLQKLIFGSHNPYFARVECGHK